MNILNSKREVVGENDEKKQIYLHNRTQRGKEAQRAFKLSSTSENVLMQKKNLYLKLPNNRSKIIFRTQCKTDILLSKK